MILEHRPKPTKEFAHKHGCSKECSSARFLGRPEVVVSENFLSSDWLLNEQTWRVCKHEARELCKANYANERVSKCSFILIYWTV